MTKKYSVTIIHGWGLPNESHRLKLQQIIDKVCDIAVAEFIILGGYESLHFETTLEIPDLFWDWVEKESQIEAEKEHYYTQSEALKLSKKLKKTDLASLNKEEYITKRGHIAYLYRQSDILELIDKIQ